MSLPKSPSVPTKTSTSDARSSVVAVVAGAAEAVPGSTPTASVAASAPATALLSRPGRRRRGAGWSPRDLTALSRRAAGVLATWTLLGGSCRGCFASKAHRTWRASRPQDVPTFLTRSRAPERSPSRVHPNRPPRRKRGCQQLDRPAPAGPAHRRTPCTAPHDAASRSQGRPASSHSGPSRSPPRPPPTTAPPCPSCTACPWTCAWTVSSPTHPVPAVPPERRRSTSRTPATTKAAPRPATAARSAPVLGSGPDDDPGPGAGPRDGGGPLGAATGTVTVDGADSTTVPRGSVALAVAVLRTWPRAASAAVTTWPGAVQVVVAAGSSVVLAHVTGPAVASATATSASVAFPVLATTNRHSTVSPTETRPSASASTTVAVFVRAGAGREGTGSARRASADRVTTVEAGAVASATAALTKPPASTSSCCTT